MKQPLVSIIIVNWNGGETFENCLKSLSKIDYSNWELIVVDNGSTDGSKKLAGRLIKTSKVIENDKNVGFALANNQGAKIAKGKYILLLNNDTKVTSSFLSKLVARIEQDTTIGVVQPKIFMMDKKGYLDNAGSFLTRIGFLSHWGFGKKDSKEFQDEREIFSAKGACMLIRHEVIEKVGLFDPDFISYFEESDFCWRVWLAGWKILFVPSAKIYHKVGFTIRRLDVSKINFDYYKNRICSLIKNLEIINLITIGLVHCFISIGIACVFFIIGQPKSSRMIFAALIWNIRNLPQTLKKRQKISELRKVSDSELFNKLSAKVDFAKFFGDFKRVGEDIKRKN